MRFIVNVTVTGQSLFVDVDEKFAIKETHEWYQLRRNILAKFHNRELNKSSASEFESEFNALLNSMAAEGKATNKFTAFSLEYGSWKLVYPREYNKNDFELATVFATS